MIRIRFHLAQINKDRCDQRPLGLPIVSGAVVCGRRSRLTTSSQTTAIAAANALAASHKSGGASNLNAVATAGKMTAAASPTSVTRESNQNTRLGRARIDRQDSFRDR